MTDPAPPGDVTLASYEAGAQRYVHESARPSESTLTYLDQFADVLGTGTVLELGSGPGADATHLESRGLHVIRTDGAHAFVARLQEAGHDVRQMDVRTADLGGPYDAVLANAVLQHLTREEFLDFLGRARRAVRPSGLLAFTVKEGDGDGWSYAKLGLPRHFTYWREAVVREALADSGWRCLSLSHVAGRLEPWIFVIATAAEQQRARSAERGRLAGNPTLGLEH